MIKSFLKRILAIKNNPSSETIKIVNVHTSEQTKTKINKVILRRKNPGFANSNPKNSPIQN